MSMTDTWLTCGRCASSMGNYEQSTKCFDRALQHEPRNRDALIGLVTSLQRLDAVHSSMENTARAVSVISSFLDRFPELASFAPVWEQSATCFDRLNLFEQTDASLRNALSLDPNNPNLWLLSSKTKYKAGDFANAAQSLHDLLAKVPSLGLGSRHSWELTQRCHIHLANIALLQNDLLAACRELELVLSFPNFAMEQRDDIAKVWQTLILGLLQLGDPSVWNRLASAEALVGPHATLAVLRTLKDVLEGNYTSGIERLLQFSENTRDLYVHSLLGTAFYHMGRFQEAFVHVSKVLDTENPYCWLLMGNLYLSLNQLEDALAVFSKLVKVPLTGSYFVAKAWEGLIAIYERCDSQTRDVCESCACCSQVYGLLKNQQMAVFFRDRSVQWQMGHRLEPLEIPRLSNEMLLHLFMPGPVELSAPSQYEPSAISRNSSISTPIGFSPLMVNLPSNELMTPSIKSL